MSLRWPVVAFVSRSLRGTLICLLYVLLVLLTSNSFAQQKYFFHKPSQTRGSDAAFNPLTLFLNGSFDAIRIGPTGIRDLSRYRWKTDFQNVWNNITHPIESIRSFGWDEFRRQELFNLSFDNSDLQFVPNLADHTIGYGMLYAKISEWYDDHGFPQPILWGIGTSLVYQYVNEMMQNGGRLYTNVDCVADYDIFNVLGYVLFSFDGVKRFFSETVELNDWSLQPLYVPRISHLENTGQEFMLRYRLPFAERYAPFICWGVNSVAGVSYQIDDANDISLGIGQSVTEINQNKRGDFISSAPRLDFAAGCYLDNNGSLLAGLIVRGGPSTNLQLNVYPGFIDFAGVRPGCYVGVGGNEGLVVGVTFMNLPVSLGFER